MHHLSIYWMVTCLMEILMFSFKPMELLINFYNNFFCLVCTEGGWRKRENFGDRCNSSLLFWIWEVLQIIGPVVCRSFTELYKKSVWVSKKGSEITHPEISVNLNSWYRTINAIQVRNERAGDIVQLVVHLPCTMLTEVQFLKLQIGPMTTRNDPWVQTRSKSKLSPSR